MDIRNKEGVHSNQPAEGSPGLFLRRDLLGLAVGGKRLALGTIVDLGAVKASVQTLKLANVMEFTTSCNFCSCGCGMVGSVREGKLLKLEGDSDHVVNERSLCVKGMAMFPTHASPLRNQTPRYHAPGSDHWVDITWEDAVNRSARKIRKVRGEQWTATERNGDKDAPVNRTDAFAFMGGAQNTNEECYLFQIGGTPSGQGLRRAPSPSLTRPHGPRFGGLVRTGAMAASVYELLADRSLPSEVQKQWPAA